MFKGLIGALRVDLGMNSAQFHKGASQATAGMRNMQKQFAGFAKDFRRIGAGMSLALTAPLVAIGKQSMALQKVQAQAVAQVDAALASMGTTAGFTSAELQKIASELQGNSLFGDEEILGKVTSNLLTFGNVTGEVFTRAQRAALDMSAALGQDLQSSTVMLGKALNDPAKGLTALTRVGVSFTEEQKNLIKAMVEVGDAAGAQELMLAELEKQYGGQAQALRELPSGQIEAAMMDIGDAMEQVGAIILPVMAEIAGKVSKLALGFQGLSPEVKRLAVIGGALAASLGPVLLAMGGLAAAVGALAPVFVAIASPIGLTIAGFAALAAGAVYIGLKIKGAADQVGGFGELMRLLKDVVAEAWDRIMMRVQAAGASIAATFQEMKADAADWLAGTVDRLTSFANAAVNTFQGAFSAIKVLWSSLPEVIGDIVFSTANRMIEGIEAMLNGAIRRVEVWTMKIGEALRAVGIETTFGKLGNVDLGGIANPYEGAAEVARSEMASAFGDAFSEAALKAPVEGLDRTVRGALQAAEGFRTVAADLAAGAAAPLASVKALGDAMAETAETGEGGAEAAQDAALGVTTALETTGEAVQDLGDDFEVAGGKGRNALKEVQEEAENTAKDLYGLQGAFDSALSSLASGDVAGAFGNLRSGIGNAATNAFSGLLKTSFSAGGSGFSGVIGGLTSAFSGMTSSLAKIGGGLVSSLGAIGGAISAALPVIGAVTAVISLIKGFSSKKLVGAGIELGVTNGLLAGGTYERIKKTKFWGLTSSTSTKRKAFDRETQAALSEELGNVKEAVQTAFSLAGMEVSDAMINGVRVAIQKIDTRDMSEAEIQERIAEWFGDYADAISDAVASVTFDQVQALAALKTMLEPLGQGFYGAFRDMALAAEDLASVGGGLDVLAGQLDSFVATFYTDAERMQMATEALHKQFADLGLAVPETAKQFRELVMGQDLMTEAGRDTYAALLSLSGLFAEVEGGIASLTGAFDLGQYYATEFDAKLAAIAEARGYSADVMARGDAGVTMAATLQSLSTGGAAQTSALRRLVTLMERWDAYGTPAEREF
ncbi:phage tail length tape measure family protein [Pseudooceanicola sp. 200-1SW]|uniref:phage tail length tape measure family protein n=1 Tax=Pseudooceanicola sp. 200-1SW TaxID=3425949 RepID=UPI003D7F5E0D